MNSHHRKDGPISLDAWNALEGHWELINGVAYDMNPMQGKEHHSLVSGLAWSLADGVEQLKNQPAMEDCRVWAFPMKVFMPDQDIVMPDICVLCDNSKLTQEGIQGPPDLIIEVQSPFTAGKDWTVKRWAYEKAGVAEYLMVDPSVCSGVLLRLEGGEYRESRRIPWNGTVPLLDGKVKVRIG